MMFIGFIVAMLYLFGLAIIGVNYSHDALLIFTAIIMMSFAISDTLDDIKIRLGGITRKLNNRK